MGEAREREGREVAEEREWVRETLEEIATRQKLVIELMGFQGIDRTLRPDELDSTQRERVELLVAITFTIELRDVLAETGESLDATGESLERLSEHFAQAFAVAEAEAARAAKKAPLSLVTPKPGEPPPRRPG